MTYINNNIFCVYKLNVNNKIYIGSCWDFNNRLYNHKYNCYNANSEKYYLKVYKYIREQNLQWTDLHFEVIYISEKLETQDNNLRRQTEQIYIDKYNSVLHGLNSSNAIRTRINN